MTAQRSSPVLTRRISRRTALRTGGAGAALAAAFLAACGGDDDDAAQTVPTAEGAPRTQDTPKAGGSLRVHIASEPGSLAAHDASSSPDATLIRLIHGNGLVKTDFDLKIVPDLAESWKISDDQTQYTFTLREGMKFTNGKPVDSKAAVENFERILDRQNNSFLRPDYAPVTSVEAVDARALKFTLDKPFAPFLAVLSHRTFITDVAGYSPTNPVGAGPWILVDWVRGSQMKFKKNPQFYERDRPLADELIVRFAADEDTGFNLLRTREVDIGNIPTKLWDQYKKSKDYTIYERPSVGTLSRVIFDVSQPPFNDQRMRDAVAMALNRDDILASVTFGAGQPAAGPYGSDHPFYVQLDPPAPNIQRAKELVKQAGFDGWSYEMPQGNGSAELRFGEYLQSVLGQLGLSLKLQPMATAAEFHPNFLFAKKFIVTHTGWTGRADPDQEFYPKYHSTGPHNLGKYSNPRMDQLLEQGRRVLADEERKKTYAEIQRILVQDKPWIYTGVSVSRAATLPSVKGFKVHADGGILYFNDVYLEK